MTRTGSSLEAAWHPRWLLMVVLLYCAPVVAAVRPFRDPDLWWHLRTGQWIVEQGRVPWTDPFSTYGAGKAWIAYSWLLEIVLYGLYRLFGLFGPLVYSTAMALALTLALHALLSRHEERVPRAAALTAFTVAAMATAFMPRTYLVSILFFVIELDVLLAVRESGRPARLALLPPLFAVWANVHVQFVYGLLLLALCGVESLIARGVRSQRIDASRIIPLGPLALTGGAAVAATLVNPYHVHVYGAILDYGLHTGIYEWVIETKAMDFRQPANWLVLAMTLLGALLLGRQPHFPIFPAAMFLTSTYLSFRAFRDVWVVVVAAACIIAIAAGGQGPRFPWATWRRALVVTVAVAAAIAGVARARDVSRSGLDLATAQAFPVRAAAVVEARGETGPVFNPYDWGGYLIWRLPRLSVSMDGRSNLHGDARIARSLATWNGARTWATDPELGSARLVIAPTNLALTSLLRFDPRFVLVHEDEVATVFVARSASPARP